MRRDWIARFRMAWDSLRVSWFAASRADFLGALGLAVLLVVAAVVVLRSESGRGACFAKTADLQSALARSDEALRAASDGDLVARCGAYRERLAVLGAFRGGTCAIPASPKGDGLANIEAESRFYSRLVETKCNRTLDPSCSGPACDIGMERD